MQHLGLEFCDVKFKFGHVGSDFGCRTCSVGLCLGFQELGAQGFGTLVLDAIRRALSLQCGSRAAGSRV